MSSTLMNDLRYAARTLARNPGFAAAAILTIALGIGVNAGIFTTVNGLLYRNLPAPEAQELVTIEQTIEGVPGRPGGFTTHRQRAVGRCPLVSRLSSSLRLRTAV